MRPRCSIKIFTPIRINIMPPASSALERYFSPNRFPILIPAAEKRKVTTPIRITAGTICTSRKAKVTPADRSVLTAANSKAEQLGCPCAALELPDGTLVTGKTSDLLGALSAVLLNALKALAGIEEGGKLLPRLVVVGVEVARINAHLLDHAGDGNGGLR